MASLAYERLVKDYPETLDILAYPIEDCQDAMARLEHLGLAALDAALELVDTPDGVATGVWSRPFSDGTGKLIIVCESFVLYAETLPVVFDTPTSVRAALDDVADQVLAALQALS